MNLSKQVLNPFHRFGFILELRIIFPFITYVCFLLLAAVLQRKGAKGKRTTKKKTDKQRARKWKWKKKGKRNRDKVQVDKNLNNTDTFLHLAAVPGTSHSSDDGLVSNIHPSQQNKG